ncbi:helix-turn-helix domain-containing protein [Streptomyces sp. GTA36]|uniref:AraC family transcriptional regulator n=1 Tax=Streptomyces sp. 2-1 TaxID=412710 RepID=UPI003AFAC304
MNHSPVIEFSLSAGFRRDDLRRAEIKFTEWRDGPLAHLRQIRIPYSSNPNGFRYSMKGLNYSSLMAMDIYSDSVSGISGCDDDTDPIAAHLVESGEMSWSGREGDFSVKPGQICMRDTRAPLLFSSAPGTRARVIKVPRDFVLPQLARAKLMNEPLIEDCNLPQVQFLLHYMEAVERSRDHLSGSLDTQNLALESCGAIFAGILSRRSDTTAHDTGTLRVAAVKIAIEKSLAQHDLSPRMIAKSLGISLRTLHRLFAESGDSPMAFARRRRLQKAHDDLVRSGNTDRITDIAARWNFSDASHFIRNFKAHYGVTPAVYLKNRPSRH